MREPLKTYFPIRRMPEGVGRTNPPGISLHQRSTPPPQAKARTPMCRISIFTKFIYTVFKERLIFSPTDPLYEITTLGWQIQLAQN